MEQQVGLLAKALDGGLVRDDESGGRFLSTHGQTLSAKTTHQTTTTTYTAWHFENDGLLAKCASVGEHRRAGGKLRLLVHHLVQRRAVDLDHVRECVTVCARLVAMTRTGKCAPLLSSAASRSARSSKLEIYLDIASVLMSADKQKQCKRPTMDRRVAARATSCSAPRGRHAACSSALDLHRQTRTRA